MKRMFWIAAVLLAVSGDTSATTVKGNLVDFGVNPMIANVRVHFDLWYPDPTTPMNQPPTCGATGILVGGNNFDLVQGQGIDTTDGTFSVTLCDDHAIVPAGALYKVTIFQNNVAFSSGIVDITGAIKTLNNACWLSPTALAAAHAQCAGSGPAANGKANCCIPMVYNVMDYGATGNGTTDDTKAVQAATNAASLVGGVVYFPPNTYALNGPIQSSCDAIICVRNTSETVGMIVTFMGAGGTPVADVIHGTTLSIRNSSTVGVDANSSIIGVPLDSHTGYQQYLSIHVQDLLMAVPPNSSIGCVNAFLASGALIENANCIAPNFGYGGPEPTHQVTGFQFPGVNNSGESIMRNSSAAGLYQGITASEHMVFDSVSVIAAIVGVNFVGGYHYITGSLDIEEVVTPIVASGPAAVDLTLDLGIDPDNFMGCGTWCYSSTLISDPSDYIHGMIRYNTVDAMVGNIADPIAVSGAANVLFLNLRTHAWTLNGDTWQQDQNMNGWRR